MAEREFTGRHALFVFVGSFGVIILVNLALAWNAVATFPGTEVKNSYVASQEFDVRREAQVALGWSVSARAIGGMLILSITDANGAAVQVEKLHAVLGRATNVKDDSEPKFQFDGQAYVAPVELAPGNWNIRMTAVAPDGTVFKQRVVLHLDKG